MPVRARKSFSEKKMVSRSPTKEDGLKENLPSILFLLAIGVIALIPLFIPDISRPFALWVQETVHTFGVWGPIVLVIVMILATIFSPIPNTLVTLTMGATYGPVWGTALALVASVIASSVAFFLARKFGKQIVEKFFPETHFIHRFLNENAFLSVFVLRVIPSVSFDLVSYGVGLTKIPYRTFVIATFFGIIPGTVSLVLVGAGLTYDSNLSIIGAGIYAALIVIGLIAFNHINNQTQKK